MSCAGYQSSPGLILFEDDHLLVINKPAGINTHSPAPYAGEGVYEWLKNREERWSSLAIIHRLDKETSGVMVFGKSSNANRSLTEQFSRHEVGKRYLFLARPKDINTKSFTARSCLARSGEKYASVKGTTGIGEAVTEFRRCNQTEAKDLVGKSIELSENGYCLWEARPITGRTHQIRVQAADNGLPILGDQLYGGSPHGRVCLHAYVLTLRHPVTGNALQFQATPDFDAIPGWAMRRAMVSPKETNAFRLTHGSADGWSGWYVDRMGEVLLSQSESPLTPAQLKYLQRLRTFLEEECPRESDEGRESLVIRGIYHKTLSRHVRQSDVAESSPRLIQGEEAPPIFLIRENGVAYECSFLEGYSIGLFLDQRENRRRLLHRHVAPGFPLFELTANPQSVEVLNIFAYTCGFSVCAALAGARATSLDLSRKYLEWGRRNFERNGLDPARHDFIYGDAMDWMRRFRKKSRRFDLVVLDPPTFSKSKESGVFRAEKDYADLVAQAVPLIKPKGTLLVSTNAARLAPEDFLQMVHAGIKVSHRAIEGQHYVPQPCDFPMSRDEPAYLKTCWIRLD